MTGWLGYLPAVLIIACAAAILILRIGAFIRTGGRSSCEHCPYSGQCAGSCRKKRKKT